MTNLEDLMIREGRDRAERAYNRAIDKGQIAYVDRGRHLISSDTKRLADWIARWRLRCKTNEDQLKKAELDIHDAVTKCEAMGEVFGLSSTILAFVVTDYIFTRLGRTYAKPRPSFFFQTDLGTRIQEEMVYRFLKKNHRETWDSSLRYAQGASAFVQKTAARRAFLEKGLSVRLWTPKERSIIGGWFLEAFRICTGHVKLYSKRSDVKGVKYVSMVALTDDVWDYLRRSTDDNLHYKPRITPIFEKPLPWTSFHIGGFHHDQLQKPFVTFSKLDGYEFYEDKDLSVPFKAANILGSTAWTISKTASDTFDHYCEKGIVRAGLVKAQPDDLPEFDYSASVEDRNRTNVLRAITYQSNRDSFSKRVSYRQSQRIKGLLDRPFYFITRADSRGRLYYSGEFFNPQAGDFARGSLIFAEGVEVDDQGLWWLKVQGANLAGQDKLPFDQRVQWVEDNLDMIEAIAEDPLSCLVWEDFDAPFQFLAWAEDFVSTLGGNPSHVPVALDGSNNGLQLFSLILRDRKMAEATNVVPVDAPNDIYSQVAEEALRLLHERSCDLSEEAKFASMWLSFFETHYDGKVPRKLAKRPVMTKAYNVSQWRVSRYLKDWMDEEHYEETHRKFPWKAVEVFSNALWDAMEDMLRGASEGMQWLKDCARIVLDEVEDVPWWLSPSGFPVYQPYYRVPAEKVKLVFGQQTRIRNVMGGSGKRRVRKAKVINGVSPNFIHGVDAAIAHRLAIRMEEKIPGVSLRFVHDSFGTHAQHAQVLSETIREVVYEVTRDDLLGRLKDEWEGRYGVSLPDTPPYGELDTKEILQATYAYS